GDPVVAQLVQQRLGDRSDADLQRRPGRQQRQDVARDRAAGPLGVWPRGVGAGRGRALARLVSSGLARGYSGIGVSDSIARWISDSCTADSPRVRGMLSSSSAITSDEPPNAGNG